MKTGHLVGDSLKKGIILKALSGFYYVEEVETKKSFNVVVEDYLENKK